MKLHVLALPIFMSASMSSNAADWFSCEYDLDRARKAARDASYAAAELANIENELQ